MHGGKLFAFSRTGFHKTRLGFGSSDSNGMRSASRWRSAPQDGSTLNRPRMNRSSRRKKPSHVAGSWPQAAAKGPICGPQSPWETPESEFGLLPKNIRKFRALLFRTNFPCVSGLPVTTALLPKPSDDELGHSNDRTT